MQTRWLLFSACLIACGGVSPAGVTAAAPQSKVEPQAPRVPTRPQNTLYRDEVEAAKGAGLGHVFELVDLEPNGDVDPRGRMTAFKGFQIVALRPASEWLSFDFAPGDILTHVNGISVEHYSTWFEQFEALSKADQFQIDLIRDGKPKTVVIKIVARGAGSAPAAPASSDTPKLSPAQPQKVTSDAKPRGRESL